MNRVFVHVEWRVEVDPDISQADHDDEWTRLLAPLFDRAMALGGRVVGWGHGYIVVDFSWDGLYDAVDFLVDEPFAPELAAGICLGEAEVICDGPRLALVVGRVLLCARSLAQSARPGEVLISPELAQAAQGRLGTLGEAGHRLGRPALEAFVLDPEAPLLETSRPSSGRGRLEVLPNVVTCGPPSSRAPESETARHVERLVSVAEALGDAVPAVFPLEMTAVLRSRDAASLKELAKSVRAKNALGSAERLEAIAELAGGKSGEALRKLRRSKEVAQDKDPSTRCQASLALAVALSAAGRSYEAALEGLEGVARARQGGDRRGEVACARFLAQVAQGMGDAQSASEWAGLGA